MNTEEEFLSAIQQTPEDDQLRLVYADWLEERGDPRAEYLRLECQLRQIPARLTVLIPTLDQSWLNRVTLCWRVLLDSFPRDRKINTIKAVREVTGWGLKECKDLVEMTGMRIIKDGVSYQEAEQIVKHFEDVAKVTMQPSVGAPPSLNG